MSYYRGSMLDDAPVVKNLIVMNVVAFIAQMLITEIPITSMGAMYHYEYSLFRPYQIVTHMFLHGGIGHIFFNMFTLFSFGPLLERVWGNKRFLTFYLVCGLAAALAQQLVGNMGEIPTLGASGAIMGVIAAFAYLFPNTELMMMFIPMPIKAKYMVAIIIALDLFGGFANHPSDNVAHFAHLGGAVAGFILVFIWNKTNKKTFY